MMVHTRQIIDGHVVQHDYLGYYKVLIEKIEENADSNPDIAIESCKSLIEGVSKTVILRLNTSKTQAELDKMDFPPLFRQACWEINSKGPFETDFIHRTGALIDRLAELRNQRGDISHGKSAPKSEASTPRSANMVMRVTDGIVSYLLLEFVSIDLTYKEPVRYEDNVGYNRFLDEQYPLEGILYSKALFDQGRYDYEIGLSDWLIEQDANAEKEA